MDGCLRTIPPVPKHSKELQTAVQDDIRRKQIDSAKKRAAAQNVDYESFAALVSMAHVKPFERKRGQQEDSARHTRALPAWSFDASGSLCSSDCSKMIVNELTVGQLNQKTGNGLCLPRETGYFLETKQEKDCLVANEFSMLSRVDAIRMTADSFKREWRNLGTCFQGKLTFLLALSFDELPKIFKADLPPSILADVIEVLYWWTNSLDHGKPAASDSPLDVEGTHCPIGDVDDGQGCPQQRFDAQLALQMLKALCECGRFSLSLKLAGKRVHHLAKELVNHLTRSIDNKSDREECILCMSSNKHSKNKDNGDDAKVHDWTKEEGHITMSLGHQASCCDELNYLASLFSCL